VTEAIPVDAATVRETLTGLPLMARLTLSFAARLQRGSLEVRLPDRRCLRFGGLEPGPQAVMIVNNFGFARRFIGGGDIGIAEAYCAGSGKRPI
jgi:cyclopropane-fatty-acyl-phospholipid synthase